MGEGDLNGEAGALATTSEENLLAELEDKIRSTSQAREKEGRSILLRWLRERLSDPHRTLSVSELLINASKLPPDKDIASVVLRSLAGGILEDTVSNNELARAVVSIAETGQPELYAYLRIDPKAQSYIKLQKIRLAHDQICEFLSPLSTPFSDTDTAIGARKEILGKLNHGIVRSYCAVYDFQSIKSLVEGVYQRIKSICGATPTLLLDVESCRRSVEEGRQLSRENGSFIARDFLVSFLNSVERTIEAFLQTSRERFSTTVLARAAGTLQKRYPLHEPGREFQISVPFRNAGPGLAVSLVATTSVLSDSLIISNPRIYLGSLLPGDFSVVLDAFLVSEITSLNFTVLLEWGEIGESFSKSEIFEFRIDAQSKDVDWISKEYWYPFSQNPVEGSDFIGRKERVRSLAAKILRSPMESFYITGQKRVGKTSLALASIDFAKQTISGGSIASANILWGSFANEDPRASLEALGRRIESMVRAEINELYLMSSCDFSGSLSDLIRLLDLARQIDEKKRFVILIDEFDEIHQELYLQGNLAETFFANMRALSRCKNVCIVLVGGENMPYVMERQGQKLNSFSRVSLSYFNRSAEWADFKAMICSPTEGVVSWYDDAIGEVFNVTNGNPYFAKLVCAQALEVAIAIRDTDIGIDEIQLSIEAKISTLGANSFIHLWQDGIPKPVVEREPDVLRRLRVLVSIARCLRRRMPTTIPNIFESRGGSILSEGEVSAVLNDFVRREVLIERDGVYAFLLPIFEKWLVDVGASQLASDALTAELASSAVAEELAVAVRADEIAALVRSWPAYRGRHVGSEEVREWLHQVNHAKDQRLLFNILQRLRVLNEGRVREMLEQSFTFLQPLPEFVIRKKSDRRKNIIVTYVDGEGKSGYNYASIFAEANLISSTCIFPPGEFEKRLQKHIDATEAIDSIVIVDDLVGTGKSLLTNVEKFFQSNGSCIPAGVPVRIIALVATPEGQRRILTGLQKFPHPNIDFKACEIVGPELYAFPEDRSGWPSSDDFDRAKALCVDLGRRIYKQSPLGYGDSGLLIIFPTNAPNNSLPILHSASRVGAPSPWRPLFSRVTH